MAENFKPLPVSGYTPQTADAVALVDEHKKIEEFLLRHLDELAEREDIAKRWLAIGRTHLEQAFMAINRSVFQPQRVKLTEEEEALLKGKSND